MNNTQIKLEYLKARNLENADITINQNDNLIIVRDYTVNSQMETYFMFKTETGKLKKFRGLAKVNYINTEFGIDKYVFKNEFVK